jgi:hypothetical protein
VWKIEQSGEYAGTPLYNLSYGEVDILVAATYEQLEGYSLGLYDQFDNPLSEDELRDLRKEVHRVYQEGV